MAAAMDLRSCVARSAAVGFGSGFFAATAAISTSWMVTAPCGPVPVTVSTSRVYAEEAQTRHQVTATAIEDATIVVQPYNFSFTARATWSAAGRDHSDIVTWSDQVKAGDQQLIWVNAEGATVGPPSSSSD